MRSRTATRAGLASVIAAALLLAFAAPASATTVPAGSTNGASLSVGESVLIFVGIPLAFAALVWLLVAAPGWTRGGRADAATGWSGDPLMLGGERLPQAAALPPGNDDSSDSTSRTGGTGAAW